jgi:hypothetical protein
VRGGAATANDRKERCQPVQEGRRRGLTDPPHTIVAWELLPLSLPVCLY